MKEHYVYIHLNPKTNEIFYVSKGKGHRKSSKTGRNKKGIEYVQKLNGQFKILVLQNNLTEVEALELEKRIISKIDWHYDDLTTNVTLCWREHLARASNYSTSVMLALASGT